jgi:hypothetical protein
MGIFEPCLTQAWFKTGLVRVTVRTDDEPEKGVTNEWLKMAQNGTFWEVFWAISLGPEAIRTGAFSGWAELRSLERKRLICQALCRWIPPISSQPPARDRGCRIAPRTVVLTCRMCDRRPRDPLVMTHNQGGGKRGAHPERTQSLSITVLCFSKKRNANFTIRRENWSKSLTALGKKLSKNFQIVPLITQQ